MPNIAIFGGTFNPVHWGHLLIAETAIEQFLLDRVMWVPSFRSPHKAQSLLAFEHRLEMVRRAIADQPAFTVSAIEGQQQGLSYAITTLNMLRALEPKASWYWIIGSDAFQTLPRWYESDALIAQCIWLVAPRRMLDETVQRFKVDERDIRTEITSEDVKSSITNHDSFLPPVLSSTSRPPPQLRWHCLQAPFVDVSSTLVRQRCHEGRSIRYLVPEAVRCYIAEQKLYQIG